MREIDDHALGEPGEITRAIQAKFEDALHGRAEEYREWLDSSSRPARPGRRVQVDAEDRRTRDDRAMLHRLAAAQARRAPVRTARSIHSHSKGSQIDQVQLYDTTLRDGMQGQGMSLSARRRCASSHALDELGVHFIEAGFPGSNPKELELFELLAERRARARRRLRLRHDPPARRRAPTRTRRCACSPTASRRSCTLVGKTWGLHLEKVDQGRRARRTWR